MLKWNSLTIVSKRTWAELVEVLRRVPLKGDPSIFPYKEAVIAERVVSPNEVYPISKYVLSAHLEAQEKLHELFLEQRVDSLELNHGVGSIKFTVKGEKGIWVISPPLVEESEVDNKPVLIDGEHRFWLARKWKQPVRVVWIKNVPKEYPPVALPVDWDEIKEYEVTPGWSEKRIYRRDGERRYWLYRNLDEVSSGAVREPGES